MATPYENYEPREPWKALDEVLKVVNPDISYLKYKEIEDAVHTNTTGEYWDYYGNGEDYDIWYITLEEIYKILEI